MVRSLLYLQNLKFQLTLCMVETYLIFEKIAETEKQLENIAGIAEGYLGYPGTRELWAALRHYFPPIRDLVDGALEASPLFPRDPTGTA